MGEQGRQEHTNEQFQQKVGQNNQNHRTQQQLNNYQQYLQQHLQSQNQQHCQNSHWSKVKNAFLTTSSHHGSSTSLQRFSSSDGPIHDNVNPNKKVKSDNEVFGCDDNRFQEINSQGTNSFGGSLPPSPNTKESFVFEGKSLKSQLNKLRFALDITF